MTTYAYDTLSEAIDDLKTRGYDLDFNLAEKCLECPQLEASYPPSEFEVKEVYRFEGISNPDDMSVVYAIESNDGKKGTLVDAYGAYSDPLSADMIEKLKYDPLKHQ